MTLLLTQMTQFHDIMCCFYTLVCSSALIVRSNQFLALLENTKLKAASCISGSGKESCQPLYLCVCVCMHPNTINHHWIFTLQGLIQNVGAVLLVWPAFSVQRTHISHFLSLSSGLTSLSANEQAGFEVTEWSPPFANQSATCHMPQPLCTASTPSSQGGSLSDPAWIVDAQLYTWGSKDSLSLVGALSTSTDVLCERGNSQHDVSFHFSEQETLPCSRVDRSKHIPWAFSGGVSSNTHLHGCI